MAKLAASSDYPPGLSALFRTVAKAHHKLRWHLRNIHHLGEDEIDGIIRKLMGR